MAYADQEISTSRIVAIGAVALLHAFVGYALITGLAYNAAAQLFQESEVFDVKEEKEKEPDKKPEPPKEVKLPPPPKNLPPPPPQKVVVPSAPTPPPPPPPQAPPPPPAPPVPPPPTPAPPPPPRVAQKAVQKGGAISDDDYPSSSIRNEEAGTSNARFTIGTDGRVTECSASGASPALDAKTCELIQRRFRFKPALDSSGSPIAESRSQRVTWRLPKG